MILQYRNDPCSYMFLILIFPAFFPRSEKEHLPPGILISGPWATLRRASLNQAHAAARQHPKQKEVRQLQCHPSWRFFMENLRKTRHIALHQKLVGGLEPWIFMTFHILGMSSSQVTNEYFFRGVGGSATNQQTSTHIYSETLGLRRFS